VGHTHMPPSGRPNSTRSTLQTWLSTSGDDHGALQANDPVCAAARRRKGRVELSHHNHSRISAVCFPYGMIQECPFLADSVPVGVHPCVHHRCHLAPMMNCRHQHFCSSTIKLAYANPCITFGSSTCLPCMGTQHRPTSSRPVSANAGVRSLRM